MNKWKLQKNQHEHDQNFYFCGSSEEPFEIWNFFRTRLSQVSNFTKSSTLSILVKDQSSIIIYIAKASLHTRIVNVFVFITIWGRLYPDFNIYPFGHIFYIIRALRNFSGKKATALLSRKVLVWPWL